MLKVFSSLSIEKRGLHSIGLPVSFSFAKLKLIRNIKKMKNSKPDGVHYLISFFGCDQKQIGSIKFWKKVLPAAVACSKMTVLHDYYYQFSPCGITGFLLLSSSHLSLHTWPENDYVACDVFSCSDTKDTEKVVEYLKKNITHQKIEIKKEKRGFAYCQI